MTFGAKVARPATLKLQTPGANSVVWPIAAIAVVALLQIELIFNRPVNWDEFFHLSEAHAFYQGRLTEALQVFYARAFFWLPMLPLDAVDQIRIARVFMFACEMFTVSAIYAIARRFVLPAPAALAALAYIACGYVFQHGFSYRADPMAANLLMGALWILTASRLNTQAILGAAFLTGLAVLTTIKVVFYAPAFLGIAILRWSEATDRPALSFRMLLFACAAVVFASLFVGLTMLSLPPEGTGSATKTVATSGTMMFDEGLFPRWAYIAGALATGPLTALLILTSPIELRRDRVTRSRTIALALLMLPLASLVIYRNSFPYFYAFILPPALVGAAIAARAVLERIPAPAIALAFVANAAIVSFATPREVLPRQKQVLAAVHEIFPEPVPYFDFPGMIVDFPKANFFMTTWGYRKYRLGQETRFVDVMSRETVPLLVINQAPLDRNQTGEEPTPHFHPDDAQALREGFIPHWGPLWVAGRRFPAMTRQKAFTVYAPGVYTLENGSALIDGVNYKPGQTLELTRGLHRFERNSEGEILLRWGDHLRRPSYPFDRGPLFKDF